MTVITKASDLIRKADIISAPLVIEPRFDEERAQSRTRLPRTRVWIYRSQCNTFLLCLTFFTTLMLLAGTILGLVFLSEDNNSVTRYKGYCSIPVDFTPQVWLNGGAMPNASPIRIPLHWTTDPDMTILSNMGAKATSDFMNNLLERFEIDDNVEKISVENSGHNVEFIHDFGNNATNIVDNKRCFILALDREMILNPSVFVLSIARGDSFDVSGVQRRLRAVLPPKQLPPAGLITEACRNRATYQLEVDNSATTIRKRSADEPKHDYLHFAGKHIQKIYINNMKELLEYEKNQLD